MFLEQLNNWKSFPLALFWKIRDLASFDLFLESKATNDNSYLSWTLTEQTLTARAQRSCYIGQIIKRLKERSRLSVDIEL